MHTQINRYQVKKCIDIEDQISKVRNLNSQITFFENSSDWYHSIIKDSDYMIVEDIETFSIVAVGFISYGWLNKELHLITSIFIDDEEQFLKMVNDEVKNKLISTISFEKYDEAVNNSFHMENWKANCMKSQSYFIDLRHQKDIILSKNHKRNIKKAIKQDVQLINFDLTTNKKAILHENSCASSYEHRLGRGEKIESPRIRRYTLKLLGSKYAEIYFAGIRGTVLSSDLVIRLADSVYYDSGGSNEFGKDIGASYFLMNEIIKKMSDHGVSFFSFGIANSEGLKRFKIGFGAVPVRVERQYLNRKINRIKRILYNFLNKLLRNGTHFFKR